MKKNNFIEEKWTQAHFQDNNSFPFKVIHFCIKKQNFQLPLQSKNTKLITK